MVKLGFVACSVGKKVMKGATVFRLTCFWILVGFSLTLQTESFAACIFFGPPFNSGDCTYAGLNGDGSAAGAGTTVSSYDNVTGWLSINICTTPEDVCDCAVVVGPGHPCDGCSHFSSFSPAVCASNFDCTVPCRGNPGIGSAFFLSMDPDCIRLAGYFRPVLAHFAATKAGVKAAF